MPNTRKILKRIGIIIVAVIIIGYAYFQTINLLSGPIIQIDSPISGATINQSLVKIQGNIKNATYITMNGRKIFVDENGELEEKFLLSEGYNVIEIEVVDKFEKTKKEVLELIYKPGAEKIQTELKQKENIATTTEFEI
ncbi:hypothetical protein KKG48_03465 [Patescibacteria group bacterium]|nr:hypothetical protein [Patescibacteria group bacterium]MCG2694614.1 hypothetical protein [Candidatus Parcubacteria bacterium]